MELFKLAGRIIHETVIGKLDITLLMASIQRNKEDTHLN